MGIVLFVILSFAAFETAMAMDAGKKRLRQEESLAIGMLIEMGGGYENKAHQRILEPKKRPRAKANNSQPGSMGHQSRTGAPMPEAKKISGCKEKTGSIPLSTDEHVCHFLLNLFKSKDLHGLRQQGMKFFQEGGLPLACFPLVAGANYDVKEYAAAIEVIDSYLKRSHGTSVDDLFAALKYHLDNDLPKKSLVRALEIFDELMQRAGLDLSILSSTLRLLEEALAEAEHDKSVLSSALKRLEEPSAEGELN